MRWYPGRYHCCLPGERAQARRVLVVGVCVRGCGAPLRRGSRVISRQQEELDQVQARKWWKLCDLS